METPQKATKSVPKKIDLVNQQPPKPTQQNNPEPSSIQSITQTHTPTQQMTIPEPVIETVVRESVLVTESEPSVSIPVSKPTQIVSIGDCHYQKGGDCWNKWCFAKSPLKF